MILVVCPNLTIDVTLEVDALERGGVHRARRSHRQAGGKGVNVARTVQRLGEHPVVLGFVGGAAGDEIADRLTDEGIESRLVPIDGTSRTCTIALEPSGTATVVNEDGPLATDDDALIARYDELAAEATSVALMGSLPPGSRTALYRELLERTADIPSVVDTSGAALDAALPAAPSMVTPNRSEAAALVGRSIGTTPQAAEAAREIRSRGAGVAVITLGKDGVVVCSGEGDATCASTDRVDLRYGNPTGAGDAFVGGVLVGHARGFPLIERVRLGVAAATASLAEGYGRFRAKDIRLESIRWTPTN